jgi:hypothetical protein
MHWGLYFHGYALVYRYGVIMNYLEQYEIRMMLFLNLFLGESIKRSSCSQNIAKNYKWFIVAKSFYKSFG